MFSFTRLLVGGTPIAALDPLPCALLPPSRQPSLALLYPPRFRFSCIHWPVKELQVLAQHWRWRRLDSTPEDQTDHKAATRARRRKKRRRRSSSSSNTRSTRRRRRRSKRKSSTSVFSLIFFFWVFVLINSIFFSLPLIWRADCVESRSTITACCQLGRCGKFCFGLVWFGVFLFFFCVWWVSRGRKEVAGFSLLFLRLWKESSCARVRILSGGLCA